MGDVTAAALKAIFADCADFATRSVAVGGQTVFVCWLDGVVAGSDISEDVVRPLSESEALRDISGAGAARECLERIAHGAVYACAMARRDTLSATVTDVTRGSTALVFDDLGEALTFETKTQTRRSISEPAIEKSVMGAKDAFIEDFRVNTGLVRRHLRSPELKPRQLTVGPGSGTLTGVLYMPSLADQATVEAVCARLRAIPDRITAGGELEMALMDKPRSAFPRLLHTERPDHFAQQLLRGKVGVLVDGLPIGFMAPCSLPELMRVPEDRARHASVASSLLILRWVALLLSLLLPALYVAVALYHQEMVPLKLLQSIIDSKQQVPFGTAAEVLGMLITFELLQEAGLRLPNPVGQTVSVIGALIVGQSAVDARVISPIAVIVVALAGIAGYTQPSQELGAAIRLWRFILSAAAVALGVYGIMAGLMLLLWRLCATESFGVCYLHPLCDAPQGQARRAFLRSPLRGGRNGRT